MQSSFETIEEALDVLELPKLVTKKDIQKQYRFLAKKYHPDFGGDAAEMERINAAYKLLMKYIEEFRYTFDEDEVSRQFPGVDHARRFRP
ncbi:heat shock protein [hydrothermal vent metagenome]|uniref:Heat shock protein n=1 Tax=hydrothermal vent metagenome TaxID=652676 RepID=A0A1W1E9U8_9ZZZZ